MNRHGQLIMTLPELFLHCPHRQCREEYHRTLGAEYLRIDLEPRDGIARPESWLYQCRHCEREIKTYTVLIIPHEIQLPRADETELVELTLRKIGELPPFGQPLAKELVQLLKEDGHLLVKAKRSEDLALGIGAFTYYRRIVEAQRGHLFGEIRRVAIAEGAENIVTAVDAALAETKFQKSVEAMKGLLPRSLLVDGNDPLALLHAACSDGVHNLTD